MLLINTCLYHLTTDVLSPNTRHATTWQGPLLWHDLPPDLYQSLDMIGHLPNIILLSCYHLTPGMIFLTLVIITITGMITWHLAYKLDSTNCTPEIHVFLIFLTCFCSLPESDNHLLNRKRRQLAPGLGETDGPWLIMFILVLSSRAWPHTWGITWRPPGILWGVLAPLLLLFLPGMHTP